MTASVPHLHEGKTGRFAGQVILVTGGARGIGKNIARAFAREAGQVVICDRDETGLQQTQLGLRQEGESTDTIGVDLSQRGAPQRIVQEVRERFGRIDVLVNNARSGRRHAFLEEDEDSWDEGISVTLKAAFFAAQEAIRLMSLGGGGCVVNISSVAALLAGAESPSYHVAKAGVLAMTRYLAAEAGPLGVRVNAVLPGFIVQDEHRERYDREDNQEYRAIAEFSHPLRAIGSSDDVARAVLFLASADARFVTGEVLVVDGGLTVQDQSRLLYRFADSLGEPS